MKVAEAYMVGHPALIDVDSAEILDGGTASTSVRDVYDYRPQWGLPSPADQRAIVELMTSRAERVAAHRRRPPPRVAESPIGQSPRDRYRITFPRSASTRSSRELIRDHCRRETHDGLLPIG
jgi:hypothetical protein